MRKQLQRSRKKIEPAKPRRVGNLNQSSGKNLTARSEAARKPTHSIAHSEKLVSQAERRAWFPGVMQLGNIGVLSAESRQRSDTLFLDYDCTRTPKLRPLYIDLRLWGVRAVFVLDSRSRKGWHREVRLNRRLPAIYLTAMQACLGSDKRRESLNIMRLLSIADSGASAFARSRWNLLFSRKLRRIKRRV